MSPPETRQVHLMEMGSPCRVRRQRRLGISSPDTLLLFSLVLFCGTEQNFCDPSGGRLCSLSKTLPKILWGLPQAGGGSTEDLLVFAILCLSPAPATGDSLQIPISFPFLSPAIPAALPVFACARRVSLYLLGGRLGLQAQADGLVCVYCLFCACFLTRILSVCRVCLESAFGAGLATHTQAHGRHMQMACLPGLENELKPMG